MQERGSVKKEIPWRSCAVAGTAGLMLTCLLLFLLSAVLADRILPQGREELAARATLFMGSFAAGILACRRNSGGKLLYVGITAGFIMILLLFLGIFTTNSPVFNISMMLNLGCVIFGVFTGGMCTLKRKKSVRRKLSKYRL